MKNGNGNGNDGGCGTVVFKYIMYGDPASKKNSKQIIYNPKTKKPMIVSSKKYNRWHKEVKKQMKEDDVPKLQLSGIMNARILSYRMNKRGGVGDVNNFTQGSLDILTEWGVIVDDNRDIIYSVDGSRIFFDKENPRTEIELSLTEEGK